jgi:hypothetical protein
MPLTEITREQYQREGLRYLRPGDGPLALFGSSGMAYWPAAGLLAGQRRAGSSPLAGERQRAVVAARIANMPKGSNQHTEAVIRSRPPE